MVLNEFLTFYPFKLHKNWFFTHFPQLLDDIFLPSEIFLFLKAALERAQKILQHHVRIVRFDQYLAMKTTKNLLFKHIFSRKMIKLRINCKNVNMGRVNIVFTLKIYKEKMTEKFCVYLLFEVSYFNVYLLYEAKFLKIGPILYKNQQLIKSNSTLDF